MHIGLSDLVNRSLLTYFLDDTINPFGGFFSSLMVSWLLNFNYCYSMSIPVGQLTVEQAHKEFNSLVDKKAVKYEPFDSREIGAVGIPAFNAKSAGLASLFAHMSLLYQRLNLPMPPRTGELLNPQD